MTIQTEKYPIPGDIQSHPTLQELFQNLRFVRTDLRKDRRALAGEDYPRMITLARTYIRGPIARTSLINTGRESRAVQTRAQRRMNRVFGALNLLWEVEGDVEQGFRLLRHDVPNPNPANRWK